jgi:hypothetical protein
MTDPITRLRSSIARSSRSIDIHADIKLEITTILGMREKIGERVSQEWLRCISNVEGKAV